jgi:hypothetical protein
VALRDSIGMMRADGLFGRRTGFRWLDGGWRKNREAVGGIRRRREGRDLAGAQTKPLQIEASCGRVEVEDLLSVRSGRGSKRAAGDARESSRRSAGDGDRLDVPDPGRVRGNIEARAVRAPAGRADRRAGDCKLPESLTIRFQKDQPPLRSRVDERRQMAPIRREARVDPNAPGIFAREIGRQERNASRRELDGHQVRQAETVADADGEFSVRRRVGHRDVRQPRHAANRPADRVPKVEVGPKDSFRVGRAARKQNALPVGHPARFPRRIAIQGWKAPARTAWWRLLRPIADFLRVAQEAFFAFASPIALPLFLRALLELPDHDLSPPAAGLAPRQEPRAVRADLR